MAALGDFSFLGLLAIPPNMRPTRISRTRLAFLFYSFLTILAVANLQ